MLGNSKPTASLSSGLLARKGQARPAMRPQGFHGGDFTSGTMNLDDLGWNDMGDEAAAVVAITPAAAPIAPPVSLMPPVLVERETLREEIEEVADSEDAASPAPVEVPTPVSAAAVERIGREVRGAKAKAAFTLRLDANRHLRLRLASASRNRSAQALVIEALDAFLASLPEVEQLASQLSPAKPAKGQ